MNNSISARRHEDNLRLLKMLPVHLFVTTLFPSIQFSSNMLQQNLMNIQLL